MILDDHLHDVMSEKWAAELIAPSAKDAVKKAVDVAGFSRFTSVCQDGLDYILHARNLRGAAISGRGGLWQHTTESARMVLI
jgi:hypothetical protein